MGSVTVECNKGQKGVHSCRLNSIVRRDNMGSVTVECNKGQKGVHSCRLNSVMCTDNIICNVM